MKKIEGGVCAPKGFKASGIYAGIRKNKTKKDLALIYSEVLASAASVYTTNLVYGAPITVTKNNLENNIAQAIICNSGNANTCNANGVEIALKTCELLANSLKINKNDIIIASTGVIGQQMNIEPFEKGMDALVASLKSDGSDEASEAIMTTDLVKKEIAFEFEIDGKICHIGGIAKGSGMIHPNMATMLAFVTTDVNIEPSLLQELLSEDVVDTFNMISVDGDTSTNDMLSILANGLALNEKITTKNDAYYAFKEALNAVTLYLSKAIAKDGEGATKLLECHVINAKTKNDAILASKSVICSSLFKAAMFGSDANWGRVLCALGYSKANLDVTKIDVSFKSTKGVLNVCQNGAGIDFSEEHAKVILGEDVIEILIDLKDGNFNATAFGCDLTYEYVKINGDYRS